MAYKKLIKVSNVCQLLDKSKYNPSQTINGVTFTNNGDGTITVNGTATSRALYGMYASRYFPSTLIGHKCLIKSNVPSLDSNIMTIHSSRLEVSDAKPIGELVETSNIYISVFQGYTVNNIIFKPQLFDLTEMYGAGNEPTTVAQFRQDFPEEMYDYSPYCWLTSYKRVFMTGGGNYLTSYQRNLTCKTKNLLPYPYYETTITRNGVTFTDNRDGTITINGTSTGFATFVFSKNYNFIAGNTYYVSTPYSIIAYKENGTIYYIQGNKSFTWSSNCEVVQIYMQINKGITLNNLKIYPMINLGDTATDYVPYGHL